MEKTAPSAKTDDASCLALQEGTKSNMGKLIAWENRLIFGHASQHCSENFTKQFALIAI